MRTPSSITVRLLLAIGTATTTVSCGGGTTAASQPNDAAADDSSASDGAAADAAEASTPDAAPDALPDAPACVRRPFLVGGVTRAGAAQHRGDWSRADVGDAGSLDLASRRALAAAWLEDGLQEHASIAAFARFTLMALAVGAPPEHIAGAQRAALDEIAHARACFALAARYGGEDVGPGPIPLEGALAPMTLAELAALTVNEGCVGETLGVQLASAQLAGATDPVVRATLEKILRDELRHAELAWSFVRWARDTGGPAVREAIARAFAEAITASRAMPLPADPDLATAPAWRAHGRLSRAEARASIDTGLRTIVEPCVLALLGPSLPRRSPPLQPIA